MVRNNLEFARDSLFIRKIKKVFKAIGPPSVHDADAIIIANELLPHSLWQNLSKLFEIKNNFNQKTTDMQSDLSFTFVQWITTETIVNAISGSF